MDTNTDSATSQSLPGESFREPKRSPALKVALAYNNLASEAELVALGEYNALRLPGVGRKVWRDACALLASPPLPVRRGGLRPGSGRRATDGAQDLVRAGVYVTRSQHAKLARLGGSVWLRQAIDSAPEPKA